jgi:hypothetical protein
MNWVTIRTSTTVLGCSQPTDNVFWYWSDGSLPGNSRLSVFYSSGEWPPSGWPGSHSKIISDYDPRFKTDLITWLIQSVSLLIVPQRLVRSNCPSCLCHHEILTTDWLKYNKWLLVRSVTTYRVCSSGVELWLRCQIKRREKNRRVLQGKMKNCVHTDGSIAVCQVENRKRTSWQYGWEHPQRDPFDLIQGCSTQ